MRRGDHALGVGIRAAAVVFVAVLTAAAAQVSVPLPFTPVPFTFQPLVVLLGAALLGPRLGACSQLLYLAAGIAGLPVFAASLTLPQGGARLLGPTGGYLMAYPVAAFLAGWLASRGFDRRYLDRRSRDARRPRRHLHRRSAVACAVRRRLPGRAAAAGFYPFVLPDILKVCVAATRASGPLAR